MTASNGFRSELDSDEAADLPWLLLDSLDIGVLAVRAELDQIEMANGCARRLLELRRAGPQRLPSWLRGPASYAVTAGDELVFGRAVKLVTASGQTLFVRGRRLSENSSLAVLTVAKARAREADALPLLCAHHGLSLREAEVAMRIREGLRNQEIADQLGISVATVKWYASKIFTALCVSNRSELVAAIDRLALSHD